MSLRNQGRGGGGLVAPVGRQDALGLVVARQPVDAALYENQAELGVLVLAVALQVLANGHRLLDQVVEVLGKGRSEAALLQNAQNLVAGDPADLGDAVPVSKHDTDLRGSHALLRQLRNVIHHIVSGQLQPLVMGREIN